jgi:hypothetical protein
MSWLAAAQNAPASTGNAAPSGTPASTDTSSSSQAPTDPQAPAQTPAPAPAPPVWSLGGIDFSGLVDGYYGINFNHGAQNQLYNFNTEPNQFNLNMAKISLGHDPDPVGFHLDLLFGHAFQIINGSDSGAAEHLEQAYVSLKPKKLKGLEVDFGQFVTSAGAEVIETNANWNYSRSLLFAWAIPYYHFGLRATFPVGGHFTGGIQVVNGWNNIEDNNSGKTVGLTGAFTSSKASWFLNYYTGPENAGTNDGFRNLFDTTLLLTPTDKANFYINYDYGRNRLPGGDLATWTGIAGAARFQLNKWFALAPRAEWFSDRNGYSTGLAQDLKEFTITAEAKMMEGLLARLEYRGDWSDKDFYDRGQNSGASKHQSTLTLGVVAFFGPKR